jgi:acetoin utilization deacetylase AcuC-like enzyme
MALLVVSSERFAHHLTPPGHPERVERAQVLQGVAIEWRQRGGAVVEPRPATDAELAAVHASDYVREVAATTGRAVSLDPDTYTSPDSYDVATLAAGAVLAGIDHTLAGEGPALALVRPPGHHAERDRAMGFCLFNNAALAAAYALEHHRMERVLIVDWDVHHGNGTQEIFWDEPRVLYVSLHQFPFYPGTGRFDEVGDGDGRGFTVNIPLPGGCGDDEWTAAFRRVVEPIAHAFKPQLVLVSAGFDAHAQDPLGGMRVTEQGFAGMADSLLAIAREHAGGRLIAALEGGYDVDALSKSVEAVLGRMARAAGGAATGPPRPRETTGPAAEPAAEGRFGEVFARVRAAQSPYWKL